MNPVWGMLNILILQAESMGNADEFFNRLYDYFLTLSAEDINGVNQQGDTPVFYLLSQEAEDQLGVYPQGRAINAVLANPHVDLTMTDIDGMTPLLRATFRPLDPEAGNVTNFHLVKLLLESGRDVDIQATCELGDLTVTALLSSVVWGDVFSVRLLLDYEIASVKQKSTHYQNLSFCAQSFSGQEKVVALQAAVEVGEEYRQSSQRLASSWAQVIYEAAVDGNDEILSEVLKRTKAEKNWVIDLDWCDEDGITALYHALTEDHGAARLRLLLQYGAELPKAFVESDGSIDQGILASLLQDTPDANSKVLCIAEALLQKYNFDILVQNIDDSMDPTPVISSICPHHLQAALFGGSELSEGGGGADRRFIGRIEKMLNDVVTDIKNLLARCVKKSSGALHLTALPGEQRCKFRSRQCEERGFSVDLDDFFDELLQRCYTQLGPAVTKYLQRKEEEERRDRALSSVR